jgi:hypothetical protein
MRVGTCFLPFGTNRQDARTDPDTLPLSGKQWITFLNDLWMVALYEEASA